MTRVSRTIVVALSLVGALVLGREGPRTAPLQRQAPPTPTAQGTSTSEALQRGITLMETRGDCAGAIRHFAQAARGGSAAIAVRALLLRGQCEERLGRTEAARTTYERLLRDHSGADAAFEARRRLARLPARLEGEAFPGVRLERLDVPSQVPSGSLSRDGRSFIHHDERGGAWLRDMATGRSQLIVFGPGAAAAGAAPLLLSPDGTTIAYMWSERGRPTQELRVRALPDGEPRTLVTGAEVRAVRPVCWRADGTGVIALASDAAGRVRLSLIDVASGRIEALAAFGSFEPYRVTMSPDGRWLAYDSPTAGSARDLFVLDMQSRESRLVASHPANDVLPEFLPDGSGLLFASDRLGPLSLWLQPMRGGKASGAAVLVRRQIGRIAPLGAATDGSFAFGLLVEAPDIHTARLGADGRFVEQADTVGSALAGVTQGPDWSPDGAALVYGWRPWGPQVGAGGPQLVVRDRSTGAERVLRPDLYMSNGHRWSYDGTRLVVRGHAPNDHYGLHVVDARTGADREVFSVEDQQRETDLGAFQWVPGKETIAYAFHRIGIRLLDLASGTSTTFVDITDGRQVTAGRGLAFAPDGETLAYSLVWGNAKAWSYALFVRRPDATTTQLLDAAPPDEVRLMGWMPDGQSLVVIRTFERRDGPAAKTEVWQVPIDGSAPRFTGVAARGLHNVAIHPDGKEIAYVYGTPRWQTWILRGIKQKSRQTRRAPEAQTVSGGQGRRRQPTADRRLP